MYSRLGTHNTSDSVRIVLVSEVVQTRVTDPEYLEYTKEPPATQMGIVLGRQIALLGHVELRCLVDPQSRIHLGNTDVRVVVGETVVVETKDLVIEIGEIICRVGV